MTCRCIRTCRRSRPDPPRRRSAASGSLGLTKPLANRAAVLDDPIVDRSQIKAAFDEVFDQAVALHGFADYKRDYDVYVYATAASPKRIATKHLRYRFKHCVRASTTSALPPKVWARSLDDRLVDYAQGRELDGHVWGVKWQELYPGMQLISDSADAQRWSSELGIAFHEAVIETNVHNTSLVFSDLIVEVVTSGYAPFIVPDCPD